MMIHNDTIAAIASGTGGAVSLIRVSGKDAIDVVEALFDGVQHRKLGDSKGFTIHYGTLRDGDRVIDDVLVSVFRAPHSYTGEHMVEVSCHGSRYIQQEVMRLLFSQGVRMARPGEFTLRAFLSGKMDLSQAEAVADIISSESKASHTLAVRQMRGGYSAEFKMLRGRLLDLASLLELELDFSEEEVEFADRQQLLSMLSEIHSKVKQLQDSFHMGNVLKQGIPVAIVGVPNVGKSTLLNALFHEEKALVSEIAGTTRDVIEDTLQIGGVCFRFIDTAGIRHTDDPLENMGIRRTFDRIEQASVLLLLVDVQDSMENIYAQYATLSLRAEQKIAVLLNKCDRISPDELCQKQQQLAQRIPCPLLPLSAKMQTHMETLFSFLQECFDPGVLNSEDIVIFNSRHYEILHHILITVERARQGLLSGLSGDLLSEDVREILHYIGQITGEITTEDILQNIFSKFCIGK